MSLRFQPPRGELKFWSILWMVFGILGSIFCIYKGWLVGLVLTIPSGLLTLGIWLRIKACGYLLLGFQILACVVAMRLMFRGGGIDWHRLPRIALSGYFAYLIYRWIREFDEDEERYLRP